MLNKHIYIVLLYVYIYVVSYYIYILDGFKLYVFFYNLIHKHSENNTDWSTYENGAKAGHIGLKLLGFTKKLNAERALLSPFDFHNVREALCGQTFGHTSSIIRLTVTTN